MGLKYSPKDSLTSVCVQPTLILTGPWTYLRLGYFLSLGCRVYPRHSLQGDEMMPRPCLAKHASVLHQHRLPSRLRSCCQATCGPDHEGEHEGLPRKPSGARHYHRRAWPPARRSGASTLLTRRPPRSHAPSRTGCRAPRWAPQHKGPSGNIQHRLHHLAVQAPLSAMRSLLKYSEAGT